MYNKDKEEVTNFDSILKYLIDKGSPNFEFMCKKLNLDYDIAMAYCEEMFEQGLLFFDKAESGNVMCIEIQSKGKKFIHHGGYTKTFLQQEQDKLRKEELENLLFIELKKRSERNKQSGNTNTILTVDEKHQIKDLVVNDIEEAFNKTITICQSKNNDTVLNPILVIQSMHKRNDEIVISGVASIADIHIYRNQVVSRFLMAIDNL